MIPYEELDRALARWKNRAQGAPAGGDAAPSAPVVYEAYAEAAVDESAVLESAEDGTPMPIPAEELGSIPNAATPERTGEINVDELEAYEDDQK